MSLRALVLTSLAVGCGRSSEDTATVCAVLPESEEFQEDPVVVEVEAGGTLRLRVAAGAGCHTDDNVVECTVVEESPGVFVVTTETRWTRTEPLAMGCEYIFRETFGYCSISPLPEGAVVLKYAGEELSFEVPGDVEGCLQGNFTDA